MSISVTDLLKNERTIIIKTDVGEFTVIYRPDAMNPDVENRIQKLTESNRPYNGLAVALQEFLLGWDLLGDDQQPLPITPETLATLPGWLLVLITAEIQADMRVSSKENVKNSGAGSRRAAK